MSKPNCFGMTRNIVQYQKGLKSRIILSEIPLNFMYEAVVEPVHKHFAVNLILFFARQKT